ncbi:MAG: mechanosensitive ion channel family protein [Patescibacteria group bacterium]
MDYIAIIHKILSPETFNGVIWPWLTSHGVKILGIIIGAWIIRRFSRAMIESAVRKAIVANKDTKDKNAERKREDTLIRVAAGTVRVVIWVIALLMIISEFGLEIGPIIAAAGIVGIAVGFGGQYLIRDIISGLFIILENQYRVGDVVKIGDAAGLVENITLRKTVLRGKDGEVYHVPNGEVKVASNLSKDFARINLDISISYNTDIEKVKKVVDKVGVELAADSEWTDKILKTPEFVRIDSFGDSSINIRISTEVKPLEQWSVAGELRKRIKEAFDKEKIEIPFPQRVIHTTRK